MKRLAGVAVLVLLIAGCSSGDGESAAADTPGVTDTSILVGTHMPLTGPAAAGYSKIAPAT